MSQPLQGLQSPQGPPAPQPQLPQQPQQPSWFGRHKIWTAILIGVGALFALGVISSAVTPTPAPTTVAATDEAPPPVTEESTEPAETEPEPASVYVPKKADWKFALKTTSKQCFGSAGCNVEVRVIPTYVGTQDLPDYGTTEITYRITGDESGPVIGTITVTGDTAEGTDESISTRSSGTKIAVQVTDVSYQE